MTYNSHTRLAYCDICGNTPIDSALFVYHKTRSGKPYDPALHLCQTCIDVGAFFCITCQVIHAQGQSCVQLAFFEAPKGGNSTPIAQP